MGLDSAHRAGRDPDAALRRRARADRRRPSGEDLSNEPDLAPAHERWLGEWALREHGSDFLYVVGYPTAKRAFYTHPDPDRPPYSRGFDLIFRGIELVSGAQRLHRYDDYVGHSASAGSRWAPTSHT